MLLAVNVGNSEIKLGVFDGEELKYRFAVGNVRQRTADEYGLLMLAALNARSLDAGDVTDVIIGSVSPSTTEKMIRAVKGAFGIVPLTVGPGLKTGFTIRLNDPTELGADLAANAAGAIALYSAPTVICDVGEATSVSVVGEGNVYLGGCLLPGIDASLEALGRAELIPTAKLSPPPSPLGKSTRECMNCGVLYGQAMACSGFIKRYMSELSLPKDTRTVFTGELSEMLIPLLDIPVTHVSELALIGLQAIYRLNGTKKKRC